MVPPCHIKFICIYHIHLLSLYTMTLYKTVEKNYMKYCRGKVFSFSSRYFRCKFRITSCKRQTYNRSINIEVIEGEYTTYSGQWVKVDTLNKSIIIQVNKKIRWGCTDRNSYVNDTNPLDPLTFSKFIGLSDLGGQVISVNKIVWKKNLTK